MEKPNVYLQILKMFIGADEYRPWANKPFSIHKETMATDMHSLVIIDRDKANIEDLEGKSFDSILSVIPTNYNINLNIDVELISVAINSIPIVDCFNEVDKEGKCKTCYGTGEVEWEFESYSSDFDCPVCDGNGTIHAKRLTPNGRKEMDGNYHIDIKNTRFNPYYLKRLVDVANMLNQDEITLIHSSENMAHLFKIKDVKVLLMPVIKKAHQIIALSI